MEEIKLNITGTLPGEALVVSIFDYAKATRTTQSQETRDAWDKRLLTLYDRWDAFWVSLGVIKP